MLKNNRTIGQLTQLIWKASLSYKNNNISAVLAFPLMCFNGVTTVQGLMLILPTSIGFLVGLILSMTYYIIVVSTQIKKRHPLRRVFLIIILGLSSLYTSFFSIYNKLSEEKLIQQSYTQTVNSHNAFIENVRKDVEITLISIEKENPKILSIINLKEEIDDLNQQRADVSDQDVKGSLASRIQEKVNELNKLEKDLNSSSEYKLYSDLQSILKKDRLSHKNSIEDFDNFKGNVYKIYVEDKSLYFSVKRQIEVAQEKITFQEPNYDNYVKAPVFLVPMEMVFSSRTKRQSTFVYFAFIVSFVLELIPILLGGINIPSRLSNSPEQKTIYEGEKKLKKNKDMQRVPETIIGQVSSQISLIIEDTKNFMLEVFISFKKPIGITSKRLNNVYNHLSKALYVAELNCQDKDNHSKQKILLYFYKKIDFHDKKISWETIKRKDFNDNLDKLSERHKLKKTISTKLENSVNKDFYCEENIEKKVDSHGDKIDYNLSVLLLIDVMRSPDVGWLVNKPWLEKEIKLNQPDLGILNNSQEWKFISEFKYQEFLQWFLSELTDSHDNFISEDVNGSVHLDFAQSGKISSEHSDEVEN